MTFLILDHFNYFYVCDQKREDDKHKNNSFFISLNIYVHCRRFGTMRLKNLQRKKIQRLYVI